MGLIVQKFGGSSVKDRDRIFNVARIVMNTRNAGNDVVVVVSAQGDTTDDLMDLALKVSPQPPPRELDMLLTAGERMSAALLAMAISDQGLTAATATAEQIDAMAPEHFGMPIGDGDYFDFDGTFAGWLERGPEGGEMDEQKAELKLNTAATDAKPKKRRENETAYIPGGSMFPGVLLNGMDAPTSSVSQKNPTPVLIRVKKEAVLPNFASIDVRECFVMGAGFGQLASERALIRTESIACVRHDGKVFDTKLEAYVVGTDGKVGIPGRLVSIDPAGIIHEAA